MSSGDESDNMDLTEGSSFGSDVSESNEGTRAHDAVLTGRLTYRIRR